jgi:hypothetical protein
LFAFGDVDGGPSQSAQGALRIVGGGDREFAKKCYSINREAHFRALTDAPLQHATFDTGQGDGLVGRQQVSIVLP